MLKKHREVTEAELRRTQSELQTQQAQRVQIQSEEELAKRRIQEELRQAPSGENGESWEHGMDAWRGRDVFPWAFDAVHIVPDRLHYTMTDYSMMIP